MTCPTCKRPMLALFLSTACDHCDYGPAREKLHRGYIVYREQYAQAWEKGEGYEDNIFRTPVDADRWREAAGLPGPVREVYSLSVFEWKMTTGCLQNLCVASKLHEIFRDHRYEPVGQRAFLGSEGG